MNSQQMALRQALFGVAMSLGEQMSAIALSAQSVRISPQASLRLARHLQSTAEAAACLAAAIQRIKAPD